MKRPPQYVVWNILAVLLLPGAFLSMAYLFRSGNVIDRPKVLEELAKSMIANVLVLVNVSFAYRKEKRDLRNRIAASRDILALRLRELNSSLAELSTRSKPLYSGIPDDKLRENDEARRALDSLAGSISRRIDEAILWIFSLDAEVGREFREIIEALRTWERTYTTYCEQPSANRCDSLLMSSRMLMQHLQN